MKIHHVKISTKGEGPSHGSNTEILLDGKPLLGVRSLKYEVCGGELGKLYIEMDANVEADLLTQVRDPEKLQVMNMAGEVVGEITV